MIKTFDILLELENKSKNLPFTVSQNDLNAIRVNMTILNDGIPLNIVGITSARIAIKKPSGLSVIQDCEIVDSSKGNISVILSTQAYAEIGKHDAEIYLYEGDTVSVTSTFSYTSKKAILDNGTVTSTNDWQSINDALIRIENADVYTKSEADVKLAEKAKQTDVNNALALKSDKTYVDTQLGTANATVALKADKTYVDTQLADRAQDSNSRAINVMYPPAPLIGAKGDGTTDDTVAIQNVLNSLKTGQELLFPNGTYMVKNLILPNIPNIGLVGSVNSIIKKISSTDNTYLMASYNYLNNVSTVGTPLRITSIRLDGNNIVDDVLILQTWNSILEKCEIMNGLRYGLTFTANTLDGTLITSTSVNNRTNLCLIHNNAVQNVRIADTSRSKVSDMFFTNNYIYTSQVGLYLQTSAGTLLSGNHFYGHSSYDVQVSISSFAFQLNNNYFEGSTGTPKVVMYIQDFVANTACIFTGNTVAGEIRLYSGNAGSQFLSTGNNYRTTDGVIKNNWNINVTAISTGDRFESQRPLLPVDNNWTLNASSNSKFIANGSTTNYFSDVRQINGVINASNTILATTYGTAAPTTGTWSQGSICWNSSPVASGTVGWICVSGGSPGTWKTFGNIGA